MMGTGDFAFPTFAALYSTPHQVVGLFTQPDRTGRGHHQHPPNPLKQLALTNGTRVFQPENVNLPEALEQLRALQADVYVVAAYGQILSPELLSIPRLGAINVHASLLPKYRGASPIATAILNGEVETGVSIIQILPRLDAGPVLAVARTPIGATETAGQLEDRLAQMAVELIPPVLDQLAQGELRPLPQSEVLMTRAPKLTKAMGIIDWSKSAQQIDWHIRAMQPWPNPATYLHTSGKPALRVLILAVRPLLNESTNGIAPGIPVIANREQVVVATGAGCVEILTIQPEGKRPMPIADFLRGRPLQPGDYFGPES
jgi:methionyl-tRNA formyltransferase